MRIKRTFLAAYSCRLDPNEPIHDDIGKLEPLWSQLTGGAVLAVLDTCRYRNNLGR
jgi:hypothetical protein